MARHAVATLLTPPRWGVGQRVPFCGGEVCGGLGHTGRAQWLPQEGPWNTNFAGCGRRRNPLQGKEGVDSYLLTSLFLPALGPRPSQSGCADAAELVDDGFETADGKNQIGAKLAACGVRDRQWESSENLSRSTPQLLSPWRLALAKIAIMPGGRRGALGAS